MFYMFYLDFDNENRFRPDWGSRLLVGASYSCPWKETSMHRSTIANGLLAAILIVLGPVVSSAGSISGTVNLWGDL